MVLKQLLAFTSLLNIIHAIPTETVPPGASCRTPNNELAFCMPIYTCKLLVQAMRESNDNHEFVRQSKCNEDGFVHVCCGTWKNFTSDPSLFPVVQKKPARLATRKLCGWQHTDDRYYTDTTTAIDEFPWMAIIKYHHTYDDGVEDNMCSGSLINRRYVLTSADCVVLNKHNLQLKFKVNLGEYHRNNSTDCESSLGFPECAEVIENIDVEEVIVHPNYTGYPTISNNIALLRMSNHVPFSDYIRPICLPDEDTEYLEPGDEFITSGWGAVDVDAKKYVWDNLLKRYSVLKKRSTNKIVPATQCKEDTLTRAFAENIDNEFCVRNDTNCIGDSGGPAMKRQKNFQWVQHAVFLNSNNCKNETNLGVYEKLYHHMDWIRSSIFN